MIEHEHWTDAEADWLRSLEDYETRRALHRDHPERIEIATARSRILGTVGAIAIVFWLIAVYVVTRQ